MSLLPPVEPMPPRASGPIPWLAAGLGLLTDVEAARDLMLLQMGAQSNLFAALAWTLVNLLLRRDLLERVRAGDDGLLKRCAHASIRLAQRSLTLRRVLRPLEIETGSGRYRLAPGVFLATMLSVTNPTAGPGLDRFDPDRYAGRRLADAVVLPARELVAPSATAAPPSASRSPRSASPRAGCSSAATSSPAFARRSRARARSAASPGPPGPASPTRRGRRTTGQRSAAAPPIPSSGSPAPASPTSAARKKMRGILGCAHR